MIFHMIRIVHVLDAINVWIRFSTRTSFPISVPSIRRRCTTLCSAFRPPESSRRRSQVTRSERFVFVTWLFIGQAGVAEIRRLIYPSVVPSYLIRCYREIYLAPVKLDSRKQRSWKWSFSNRLNNAWWMVLETNA